MRKFKYLQNQVSKGNSLAVSYLEKIKNKEASIEWAYRVVITRKKESRTLQMMAIADKEHLGYANQDELWNVVSIQIRKQGFDPAKEEDVDSFLESYIDSKPRIQSDDYENSRAPSDV